MFWGDESYERLDTSGIFQSDEFKDWKNSWNLRRERQDRSLEISKGNMKKYNPTIIPRNHQVERALAVAVDKGDYTVFNELLAALTDAFNYDDICEEYMTLPDDNGISYKTYCGT